MTVTFKTYFRGFEVMIEYSYIRNDGGLDYAIVNDAPMGLKEPDYESMDEYCDEWHLEVNNLAQQHYFNTYIVSPDCFLPYNEYRRKTQLVKYLKTSTP